MFHPIKKNLISGQFPDKKSENFVPINILEKTKTFFLSNLDKNTFPKNMGNLTEMSL